MFGIALGFSKPFSSERLLLGGSLGARLIALVVQQHKRLSRLFHIFLGYHRQRDMSVLASSEFRRHGRRISTNLLMWINR